MRYKKFEASGKSQARFYIVLDQGDDVVGKLKEFAKKEEIAGASIKGIGTLKDPELGFFDLEKKEYKRKVLEGEFELLSILGNISVAKNGIVVHLHALISDDEFKAYGGHLFRGEITGTAEMLVDTLGERVERKFNERTRLNLMEL